MKYIKKFENKTPKSEIKSLYLNGRYDEKLSTLPDLSEYTNLEYLYCNNNILTELPKLPDTLIELDCSFNQLEELPKLPKKLSYLNCGHNNLNVLPELPNTLTHLWCDYNSELKDIPNCPKSLEMLDTTGTLLPYQDSYEFKYYYKNILYPELGAADKYNL